jgi:glycerol kinase
MVPIHKGDARAPWMVRMGLTLYDGLAGRANLSAHAMVDARAALALEPDLRPQGLRAAALYSDVVVDDVRLAIAVARDAAAHGAEVHPYTEAIAARPAEVGTVALIARDTLARAERRFTARAIVNASGAWGDETRRRRLCSLAPGRPDPAPLLRPSRGVHLVFPPLTRNHALLLTARSDRRVFFVVPFGTHALVGTTESEIGSPPQPSEFEPSVEEVRYLREELARVLPGPAQSPVLALTCGVRPLLACGRRGEASRRTSRDVDGPVITIGRQVHDVRPGKHARARPMSRGWATGFEPRDSAAAAPAGPGADVGARRVRGRARVRATGGRRHSPPHAVVAHARSRSGRRTRGGRDAGASAGLEPRARSRRAAGVSWRAQRRRAPARAVPGGRMKNAMVLAIDQGTTGSTALVLDARGRVRGRGYAEVPQHFPRPGWVEHEPDELWTSVVRATRAALARARVPARGLAAIGVTNQRETTVMWDRTSGRPIARAIVWQDRRTSERCAALKRRGLEADVRRRTGLVLDPYFSGTKVEWMLRNVAAARGLARRGRLAFGTVDSWILWRLTGGRVHATDPTNASRTLLYHIGHRTDAWLLDRLAFRARSSSVLPSSGSRRNPRRPARDGAPILVSAGDQQAALFGWGCARQRAQARTRTAPGASRLHTEPKRSPRARSAHHGGARRAGVRALEGSVLIAGAALQWLRDGLGILERASDSERMARSLADSAGVVLVPAFVGLGAPYWRPDVRGALFGLTRGTTRAHVVRAALESLAFQTRDLVEAMARDAGRRVPALRVDGGAAANDFHQQWQADLLGVLSCARVIETTALGAGLLAGLGAGV